jgi:hypothetical protein
VDLGHVVLGVAAFGRPIWRRRTTTRSPASRYSRSRGGTPPVGRGPFRGTRGRGSCLPKVPTRGLATRPVGRGSRPCRPHLLGRGRR